MPALKREEIENAWAIIGATPAGRVARQLLVDELMSVCAAPSNPSALAVSEGRRIFARELLRLVDKEAISEGPNDPSDGRREPFQYGKRPGQRRVPIAPPEPI